MGSDLGIVVLLHGPGNEVTVCAVVGGQFGSEGKGLIVGHIAEEYRHHVRVGAANAGHTVYTETNELPDDRHSVIDGWDRWEKHVMQQIPCAAYANPDAYLYIGPGALISPEILNREVSLVQAWRRDRDLDPVAVLVDARAQVIRKEHILKEQSTDLADRIGSTSATAREGVGAAQAARVMREVECMTAMQLLNHIGIPDVFLSDVPMAIALGHDEGVLLEGTQGTGLSLTTGHHPYITSRNTTVAGLMADCGCPRVQRTVLVCRTYPIRVAGNSGPFWYDSRELEWGALGINPDQERTTVTNKVRRVATFSYSQLHEAMILNAPNEIALTFCDYIDPSIKGVSGGWSSGEIENHFSQIYEMIREIERVAMVPVSMLGTGPHSVIDIEV